MGKIQNTKKGQYKGDEVRNSKITAKATEIMAKYHNPETQAEAIIDMINMLESYIWECVRLYQGVDEPEDLYNECVIAIIEDMPKFDPKTASPIKFFKLFSIQRALNKKKEQKLNLSNHYAGVVKKIEELERRIGDKAVSQMTNEKISEIIQVPAKTVQAARKQMHITLVNDEALKTYEDEYSRSPEQIAITNEQREALVEALSELDIIDRTIFLEVSDRYLIKWTDIKSSLMSNEQFMDALGRENLSVGYIEAHYDRARRILIRNRKLRSIRPDYDYSDEPDIMDDYVYLKKEMKDIDIDDLIKL